MAVDPKKLLRTLTVGRGSILVPHIEAYQQRAKFPDEWHITIRNHKEGDGYFHPSSDAFTPPRTLWLQMQGRIISSPISPALRRTFDCGHMWHGYLQGMLIEMGFVQPENVERYVTHKITTNRGEVIGAGTGDLVDVQIPGHGSWLVDIKTMNKVEFEQGANEFTMAKWRAQVSCYMDWFNTDKAMILAVCKDSPHQMREYQIQKDQALLNEIYDRWAYVAACLRTDTEPEDDYQVDPLLLNAGDSVLDVELAGKTDELKSM
jgi:hypothetical protein